MATVSKSITVSEQGAYTVELDIIPTGSTVTPVNNIQTWLKCAAIWDKTYTTIAQVLADATTLQALIASNNAADYMARSTGWANGVVANSNAMTYIGANNYCTDKLLANSTWCNAIINSTYFENVLNVKVPTMTSNTAPSGEAFGDAYSAAYPAWHAFDNNASTYYQSISFDGADSIRYIGYHFLNPIVVKCIKYKAQTVDSYTSNPVSIQVQGSNDGTTYENIGKEITNIPQSNSEQIMIVNPSKTYSYYRLAYKGRYVSQNGSYQGVFESLQFHGRA